MSVHYVSSHQPKRKNSQFHALPLNVFAIIAYSPCAYIGYCYYIDTYKRSVYVMDCIHSNQTYVYWHTSSECCFFFRIIQMYQRIHAFGLCSIMIWTMYCSKCLCLFQYVAEPFDSFDNTYIYIYKYIECVDSLIGFLMRNGQCGA